MTLGFIRLATFFVTGKYKQRKWICPLMEDTAGRDALQITLRETRPSMAPNVLLMHFASKVFHMTFTKRRTMLG